ncbi:aldolase/citrate lyase family protein [Natronolimnohabitans sp. A-GB9]|uniref:HpcH/HpaI aldolase family protein n=1 Tax=Natronolimnohabitans sp. A-GB9 TaxID=3069757 RepID=UPI0027AF5729|nr:aldolase/citrate lyase family protein [Natronolimnohabitans sp. A-GB9]MDQ2051038.1 aldolase/citrate lyase family protein [Natronolimnohabitans sp. A-GB9]
MPTSPRTNLLRQTLEDDAVALGVLENTYNPTLVEFYGELGLEFVWIDLEHAGPSPFDGDRLEELVRAANVTGTELLVRLPEPDPGMIRKTLDAGVRSLFVSRIETADEVRRAVEASQFEYDGDPGKRGFASPRASRWGTTDDYAGTEDAEIVVGVTIENPTAVANLEDILAVPELGFVFAGPLDLAVSLGHPGEPTHEDVDAHIEAIRTTTLETDVPLGGLGFGMDDVNEKVDSGYQLLNLGSTTGALQGVVRSWLNEYQGDRAV